MNAYLLDVLLRFGHIVFGVAWIGLLYYFNFVQTEYVKVADDGAKSDVMQKLSRQSRYGGSAGQPCSPFSLVLSCSAGS